MNVMLLSGYGQANCWFWCQKCCTWCRCHQMHWRLNVMSKLLHPTVKRPNARWRLFVDEVARAASDANAIRCTGDWMKCQSCCIWCWNHQMHWRSCFDVSTLHSTLSRSNERQLMPELLHSIAMRLNALANFFWCQDCCIWCRCHQMHADDCLLMSERLHLTSNDQMHWRSCLLMSDDCIRLRTIRCTGEVVWCQNCIRCRCHQMHWRNCLFFRKIKAQRLSDCENPLIRRLSRWNACCQTVRRANCWFDVKTDCTRLRTIRCTDDFVCFSKNWGSTVVWLTRTRRLMLAEIAD